MNDERMADIEANVAAHGVLLGFLLETMHRENPQALVDRRDTLEAFRDTILSGQAPSYGATELRVVEIQLALVQATLGTD